MGIFDWLFGRGPGGGGGKRVTIDGPGDYDHAIVGEANYQDALNGIYGGKTDDGHEHECTAILIEEPTNQYDRNAVKVTIGGQTVGYLSRGDAVSYRRALADAGLSGRAAHVDALIIGGWERGRRGSGHYGVKLDMDMPPAFS